MSLRDEMARAAYEGSLPNSIDREYIRFDADYWGRIADALMPLVERAVLNAAAAGWSMAEGSGTDADFEAIVARVTGKGGL